MTGLEWAADFGLYGYTVCEIRADFKPIFASSGLSRCRRGRSASRTEIGLKSRSKIRQVGCIWGLATVAAGAACADEAPAAAAASTEQAQAMEFGIFFGGMASQYDLCVNKGFLPKGEQSAEAIAASIIAKMHELNKGSDQSSYVQQGWDVMKQAIAKRASDYTREKCSWVGAEWQTMVKRMTPK